MGGRRVAGGVPGERADRPRRAGARRRSQSEEPRRVSASLPEAANLLGLGGAAELAVLQREWAGVVGPELARHCHPASLGKGTLVVVADQNAWAAELRFHGAAVVARAASLVPGVASVAVRVDPFSA